MWANASSGSAGGSSSRSEARTKPHLPLVPMAATRSGPGSCASTPAPEP